MKKVKKITFTVWCFEDDVETWKDAATEAFGECDAELYGGTVEVADATPEEAEEARPNLVLVDEVDQEMSREDELFEQAVVGLRQFYDELEDDALVVQIKAKVEVPDTGNDQADYEAVRSQVERLVQNWVTDRRL